MRKVTRLMTVLCALALPACAGDEVVQGEDAVAPIVDGEGSPSDASDRFAASDSASDSALTSADSGEEDAQDDPCVAMRMDWSALFDDARTCTVAEECTKPYLGYQPCSCAVFVGGEADLNALFALDAELKASCLPDDVGCPAVECPQGVVSCDEGLCRTTFEG
jgi:hypothetical protein